MSANLGAQIDADTFLTFNKNSQRLFPTLIQIFDTPNIAPRASTIGTINLLFVVLYSSTQALLAFLLPLQFVNIRNPCVVPRLKQQAQRT